MTSNRVITNYYPTTIKTNPMNTLCAIRDINQALLEYENLFTKSVGLSINEGMIICCIDQQNMSATEIACKINLSNSNCSKVLKSVEKKGLIVRCLGAEDKRQMYFTLSKKGIEVFENIHNANIPLPELLKPILNKANNGQ